MPPAAGALQKGQQHESAVHNLLQPFLAACSHANHTLQSACATMQTWLEQEPCSDSSGDSATQQHQQHDRVHAQSIARDPPLVQTPAFDMFAIPALPPRQAEPASAPVREPLPWQKDRRPKLALHITKVSLLIQMAMRSRLM